MFLLSMSEIKRGDLIYRRNISIVNSIIQQVGINKDATQILIFEEKKKIKSQLI